MLVASAFFGISVVAFEQILSVITVLQIVRYNLLFEYNGSAYYYHFYCVLVCIQKINVHD